MSGVARSAKGIKPRYFADPATDKLLSMVFTLAEELHVARERADTLERVLVAQGTLAAEAVNDYCPDEVAEAERAQARQSFMDRLLRTVQMELEAAVRDDGPISEEDIFKRLE